MFVKQNKRLVKFVAATFAFNSVGSMAIPIVSAAEQGDAITQTDAEKAKNAAALEKANAYKAAVDAAAKNTIQLNDDDDDLAFLNKVISLCTDKNKSTTVAQNYNTLIDGAKEAQVRAEAAGKEPDAMTQKLLKADDRIHKIANKLKDSGTINFNAATENLIKSYQAVYQQGIAAKQQCEAEARSKGTDPGACKLSDEAASAANFLLTNGVQQINVTATSPEKTNAVEKKGASTVQNTDSHWYRGEDGLWHEKTDVKEVKCADDEEAKDGKCVKKETPKEESKKDDVKCAENEELKDGKCVAKEVKCGEGEELKDGKCAKKEVCPTNYVESEGQCCPADHPKYDANTKQCMVKDEEKKAETPAATNAVESKSGKSNSLMTALGTLGALATMLPHHTNRHKEAIDKNQLQYTFNYLQGKNLSKDKKEVHMFPQNSADEIKFKLFQYRLPENPDGTTVKPKAVAFVQMPMYNEKTKQSSVRVAEIPLELNKMEKLFPQTISKGGEYYKSLAQYGEITRTPASEFNKPYYTMTVKVYDGNNLIEFPIHYDFATQTSYIQQNPDKKLKKGTNVVQGATPSITIDGMLSGATWDAQSQTCTIGVSGTFIDKAADITQETGDEANTIVTNRYTESTCNDFNKYTGKGYVHFDKMTVTDDGKGNLVLSDKDAQNADMVVYENATTFKNDGSMEYNEGILKNVNYKDEYKKDLVYARVPVDVKVKYANGDDQVWKGYSTDGKTLYDSDGNALTESQKAGEVKILYNTTKNPLYQDLTKVDACSANKEPDRLGMVCGFKPDGTEILISDGKGIDRDTIEAAGNMSKEDADRERKTNTLLPKFDKLGKYIKDETSGVVRGVVNAVESITGSSFFGPLVNTGTTTEVVHF